MKIVVKKLIEKQMCQISKINFAISSVKRRGSAWIEYLAIGAVIILVGYPILSAMFTAIFTAIKTWFGTGIVKIFS